MSNIFKILCQDVSDARRFGICDDKDHQRAYIDTDNGADWMAVVHNDNREEVTFTALDNCIEMRKANGTMEKRCEGMLTFNGTIIFVEIKESAADAQSWAKVADKQLRVSIASIESRVNLDAFPIKRAAITNRLQRGSKEKHTVRMKKFLLDTGYVLRVDNRINID
jgi:hypothetical protein